MVSFFLSRDEGDSVELCPVVVVLLRVSEWYRLSHVLRGGAHKVIYRHGAMAFALKHPRDTT